MFDEICESGLKQANKKIFDEFFDETGDWEMRCLLEIQLLLLNYFANFHKVLLNFPRISFFFSRLSTQQKTTNNSLLDATLINQDESAQHKLIGNNAVLVKSETEEKNYEETRSEIPNVICEMNEEDNQEDPAEKFKPDNLSQFPMSPSIEYLESNVDDDEEYDEDEYDDDKLGNMPRSHPQLPPPPTSISSLRLSQPDRVK